MIFQFPDLETFRLAITSALVPPEVSAAPAEVAFDPAGRPSVRPAAGIPPRPMLNALKKLGVTQAKDHYAEATLAVECWPQVLPVQKAPAVPEVTSNTPVLFGLPAAEMSAVVTEMLRLGNDRQSFRTVAVGEGGGGSAPSGTHVLLKVIGPPYYTLLRAIDKSTQKGATVTAYVEKAPRVWVELGYDHPMAGQLKPADGQVLLLRPERDWAAVEDGPFEDVYDVLDFQLPTAPVEWQEAQLKGKLAVPLRLVPGNAADVAELWVLTEDAVDQLDALVRDADERLLARLSFAVARENGQTTIVLKTRPSKLSPPVLPLAKATAFKPYWKLPNLFLPVGRRLTPTLRRDAVRRLLADDPAQVVWLMPEADGKFTPEVLPDDAFRPLEDWIDYVIDHDHEKLAAWVQATRFDFDSFVCTDEQPDKPKPPPGDKERKGRKGDRPAGPEEPEAPATPKGGRKKAQASAEADFVAAAEAAPPSELKIRLREVEDQFKQAEGPLDVPERVALWPELARLNAALHDKAEAAICWTNAFWELPEVPADAAWAWLRTEDPTARPVPTAEGWDAALAARMPSPEAVRGFAARVVHTGRQTPVPASFVARLPRIREYLERHEGVLGVRAAWLAWWHLAGPGAPAEDVKALAHVRDRLLQRLLTEGLNKERDLPYFLRTAGAENSERMRLVRERAKRVRLAVEKWHSGDDVRVNKPYVDLMFAFAEAKLGEATAARDLIDQAAARLLEPAGPQGQPDKVHEFLLKAFVWRIEQALQGKPHAGPLPPDLLARLQQIDEGRGLAGVNPRYVVDRLREQSWIVEPQETTDPYRDSKKFASEVQKTFADLAETKDTGVIAQTVKRFLRSHLSPDELVYVYLGGISLGPRVGEDFTLPLMQQVPAVLAAALAQPGPREHRAQLGEAHRKLFERALFMAAHYDRGELVQTLFRYFLGYLRTVPDDERALAVSHVARECMRSLRKLGLKDEINEFLTQISDLLIRGRSLPQLRASADRQWPELLISLLALAEGYLFFGGTAQARPFLDEARATIFENGRAAKGQAIAPQAFTKVVRAYVSALGQGPVDEALARIEELFQKLQPLPNAFTTAAHFSRLHLNIVEDVVRSLVSDNMTLGEQARRWLDDDEYLVRRRIHADLRRVLTSHGL